MSEVEQRHDPIQGAILHEYDGIEEADNQLPLWWVAGFVISIAFSFVYWLGFEVYQGWSSPLEEYAVQTKAFEEARAAELAAAPSVTRELLEQLAAEPNIVAAGTSLFAQHCIACHGEHAEGKIGPNLTDAQWVHGGSPLAIHSTIDVGVAAKGMPSWGPLLGQRAVRELTAFVLSVRDTHAAGGKAPEGQVEPHHDPADAL